MGKHKKFDWDIKQTALWIYRGYNRRVKWYYQARKDIIESSPQSFSTYIDPAHGDECRQYYSHTNSNNDAMASKVIRLGDLEANPEYKRMRSVEEAKLRIGCDVESEEVRERLIRGVCLNCESGREYPYEYLNLPEFSRMDFYRRRDSFLRSIAEYLDLI